MAAPGWEFRPICRDGREPHKSGELKEEVVARTVAHLKGDSLWGKYERRPTSYGGRTETGRFAATRQK